MQLTNRQAAERALRALASEYHDPHSTNVFDILVDLMHLCDYEGESFKDLIMMAERRYEEEVQNSPEEAKQSPRFA